MVLAVAISNTSHNSRSLVAHGAIPALTKMLAVPSQGAQLAAARALQMLCVPWQHQEAVHRHGGIPPLAAMLQSDDSHVQQTAAAVLMAAIHGQGQTMRSLLCSGDALPCLGTLLRIFKQLHDERSADPPPPPRPAAGNGSLRFQDRLAELISDMLHLLERGWGPRGGDSSLPAQAASRPPMREVRALLLQVLGIADLLQMLDLMSLHGSTHLVATTAISLVSRQRASARQLIEDGGVHLLLDMLSSDKPKVQRAACQSLQHLASQCDMAKEALDHGIETLAKLQKLLQQPTGIWAEAAKVVQASAESPLPDRSLT